eukprot:115992-Chlamydomonas_euryale.AAC.2
MGKVCGRHGEGMKTKGSKGGKGGKHGARGRRKRALLQRWGRWGQEIRTHGSAAPQLPKVEEQVDGRLTEGGGRMECMVEGGVGLMWDGVHG